MTTYGVMPQGCTCGKTTSGYCPMHPATIIYQPVWMVRPCSSCKGTGRAGVPVSCPCSACLGQGMAYQLVEGVRSYLGMPVHTAL